MPAMAVDEVKARVIAGSVDPRALMAPAAHSSLTQHLVTTAAPHVNIVSTAGCQLHDTSVVTAGARVRAWAAVHSVPWQVRQRLRRFTKSKNTIKPMRTAFTARAAPMHGRIEETARKTACAHASRQDAQCVRLRKTLLAASGINTADYDFMEKVRPAVTRPAGRRPQGAGTAAGTGATAGHAVRPGHLCRGML